MPTPRRDRLFTREDINQALSQLDDAIEASELLMSVAPIRFITIGGMLAVSLFGNRSTTKDIDFLLDPSVDAVDEYRAEALKIIRGVARKSGFSNNWMNDELRIFIGGTQRLNLFLQSVKQGVIVYKGRNMTIYAGRLDFALERKLRRLNEKLGRPRELDLSDAVTLVHWLKRDGHPLSLAYVRSLDENGLGIPVGDAGIEATAREYLAVYGTQGIVEMTWDPLVKRAYYHNLNNGAVFI
uniref:Uncharacterized protein n=1 Tax=Bionectria ochroleuca TaxID=29856 RepID=A0A8H7NI27_BIOOC